MSGITGNVVFSGGCVCWKKNAIARKKRKNIICLTCVGHMMHMKHMKFEKGFFERTAGENAFCRMGYELLPPPAGGPPPSKREVLGLRRSRPSALPSIAYRGFAVAPITLCAPSRRFSYNPGCRVATLLVSKGVMGFLGDLRGRSRNLPLIP